MQDAQVYLFVFLGAIAAGTVLGGPIGDRIGRKYVIWISILGVLPFTLALPYANLFWTGVLSIVIGLILSSAFSAILVYATELVPGRVGVIAGLFFGLVVRHGRPRGRASGPAGGQDQHRDRLPRLLVPAGDRPPDLFPAAREAERPPRLRAALGSGRRQRGSLPVVIEADADALALGLVDRNLVAQPALPQQHGAGSGLHVGELPVLRPRLGLAGRGRHHEAEARILELEGARPLGDRHVIGAAHHRMRMDVGGMNAAGRQDVDPQAVERELAALEVEFQFLGEGGHVGVERLQQLPEDRHPPGQVVERGVGGVARIAVLRAPALAGLVVLGDGQAGRLELGIEAVGLVPGRVPRDRSW